jgi:hypothetical protein
MEEKMTQQPMQQQMPVKREVKKGDGEWVVETISDPTTGRPLRVQSFTLEQLEMMKKNGEEKLVQEIKIIQEMIDLLK